jgi:hypothetical protein
MYSIIQIHLHSIFYKIYKGLTLYIRTTIHLRKSFLLASGIIHYRIHSRIHSNIISNTIPYNNTTCMHPNILNVVNLENIRIQ